MHSEFPCIICWIASWQLESVEEDNMEMVLHSFAYGVCFWYVFIELWLLVSKSKMLGQTILGNVWAIPRKCTNMYSLGADILAYMRHVFFPIGKTHIKIYVNDDIEKLPHSPCMPLPRTRHLFVFAFYVRVVVAKPISVQMQCVSFFATHVWIIHRPSPAGELCLLPLQSVAYGITQTNLITTNDSTHQFWVPNMGTDKTDLLQFAKRMAKLF